MKAWWLLGVVAVSSSCTTSRERGGGWVTTAHTYRAPETDRCGAKKGSRGQACTEARYLGELYVRRLATGDEVCLDGGFGEVAGAACKARALVADTGTNRVLLEVRDPRPDSRWFAEERNQFWFEEGALVDLYLADHGY